VKRSTLIALALLIASSMAACSRDLNAMSAKQLEDQYGLSGASAETVMTPDGPVKGMLVPITLANGRAGHLFIPQRQTNDIQSVYLQDEQGLHPVQLKDNTTRAELVRSPGIVETRPSPTSTRSWQKEVMIVGGSAGAGAAIGALAGGKKGAGVGAAAGGVGGLIYDLATRKKGGK
jgi:hypothetical protein